jgi:hypothetical protein
MSGSRGMQRAKSILLRLKYVCGIGLAILATVGSAQAGQGSQCIAYVRGHAIRLRCGEQKEVLLRWRGVLKYAISEKNIAIMTAATGDSKVLVIGGGGSRTVNLPASVAFLYSSCGTILATLRNGVDWDILENRSVTFTALARPVCSTDRSRIVGINSVGQLVTKSGTIIEQPQQFEGYSISPSGRTLAFFRDLELCLQDMSQNRRTCHSVEFNSIGGISLDDYGRALFVEATGETCYYRNGEWKANKVPGALPDQCFSVAMATPDAPPKPFALLGDLPSWVPEDSTKYQSGGGKK